MRVLKAGEIIRARTHAELLNELFGTNYKAWMKCTYRYSYDSFVWMVRFNEVNKSTGWENVEISPNYIIEKNHNSLLTYDRGSVTEILTDDRIVFQIVGDGVFRKYIFKGIYKYDDSKGNPNLERYLKKIDDKIIIK